MIEVSAYHGYVLSGQNLLYIIQHIQLLIYNENKSRMQLLNLWKVMVLCIKLELRMVY